MQKQDGFLHRVSNSMSLWEEPVGNKPIVELWGENRVLIEKHRGIQHYSHEKICVCVCYGQIVICGTGMEICRMSKEQLIIGGKIEGISIIRRQK